MSGRRSIIFMCVFAALIAWAWAAFDGRLHWDEPGYLYTGTYRSTAEILQGEFQPSGTPGFSTSRVAHILFVRLVVSLVGAGWPAPATVALAYLGALLLFLWVSSSVVERLTPSLPFKRPALLVIAISPAFIYLAGKTLTEIPGLLFAALSVLGYLDALDGKRVRGLTLAACSLVMVAFTRNSSALLLVALVPCLLIHRPRRVGALRVLTDAAIAAAASLALFYLVLQLTGITVQQYLGILQRAGEKWEPPAARALHVALTCGLLYLALPLAFLGARKRDATFYATWFLLATLPIALRFKIIEARYLAMSLVPLAGLVALSIDGLSARAAGLARPLKLAASTALVLALFGSAVAAQGIMAHEVDAWRMHGLLREVDRQQGGSDYAILIAWEYTDFHYLRVVYPRRRVYTVHLRSEKSGAGKMPDWPAVQRRFYGPRAIQTADQLEALAGDRVYVSYDEAFPVANLRAMAERLPGPLRHPVQSRLDGLTLLDHRTEGWPWGRPELDFRELARRGHYYAYGVRRRDDLAVKREFSDPSGPPLHRR